MVRSDRAGGKRRPNAEVERDKARAIELATRGFSHREIAEKMGKSRRTVNYWLLDTFPTVMNGREPKEKPVKVKPLPPTPEPEPQPDPVEVEPEPPTPDPAPQCDPVVDLSGKPVRKPGEAEIDWRRRWRRWQLDAQLAENELVTLAGRGRSLTRDTVRNREKWKHEQTFGPESPGDF